MSNNPNDLPRSWSSGLEWDDCRGVETNNYTWYSTKLDAYIQLRSTNGEPLPNAFIVKTFHDLETTLTQTPEAALESSDPDMPGSLEQIYDRYLGHPVVYAFDIGPPLQAGGNRQIISASTHSSYSPFHALMCKVDRKMEDPKYVRYLLTWEGSGRGRRNAITAESTTVLIRDDDFINFERVLDNSPYLRYQWRGGQLKDVSHITDAIVREMKQELSRFRSSLIDVHDPNEFKMREVRVKEDSDVARLRKV
ncbi:hypothetical protein F5884DRAFT_185562 [Xylogone sp. PMI_703]|nr:hypothetical protein F5884DRAFT_185562 [Xylogone sp. PMI_703]